MPAGPKDPYSGHGGIKAAQKSENSPFKRCPFSPVSIFCHANRRVIGSIRSGGQRVGWQCPPNKSGSPHRPLRTDRYAPAPAPNIIQHHHHHQQCCRQLQQRHFNLQIKTVRSASIFINILQHQLSGQSAPIARSYQSASAGANAHPSPAPAPVHDCLRTLTTNFHSPINHISRIASTLPFSGHHVIAICPFVSATGGTTASPGVTVHIAASVASQQPEWSYYTISCVLVVTESVAEPTTADTASAEPVL